MDAVFDMMLVGSIMLWYMKSDYLEPSQGILCGRV